MRQANLFMMSAAMLLAACGGTKDAGKTDQVLIEKSDIKIEGKRMTPEALWAMGRIGGLAVSPDGKLKLISAPSFGKKSATTDTGRLAPSEETGKTTADDSLGRN